MILPVFLLAVGRTILSSGATSTFLDRSQSPTYQAAIDQIRHVSVDGLGLLTTGLRFQHSIQTEWYPCLVTASHFVG